MAVARLGVAPRLGLRQPGGDRLGGLGLAVQAGQRLDLKQQIAVEVFGPPALLAVAQHLQDILAVADPGRQFETVAVGVEILVGVQRGMPGPHGGILRRVAEKLVKELPAHVVGGARVVDQPDRQFAVFLCLGQGVGVLQEVVPRFLRLAEVEIGGADILDGARLVRGRPLVDDGIGGDGLLKVAGQLPVVALRLADEHHVALGDAGRREQRRDQGGAAGDVVGA